MDEVYCIWRSRLMFTYLSHWLYIIFFILNVFLNFYFSFFIFYFLFCILFLNISVFFIFFFLRDRSVKVWDFSGSCSDEETSRTLALSSSSSQSTNGLQSLGTALGTIYFLLFLLKTVIIIRRGTERECVWESVFASSERENGVHLSLINFLRHSSRYNSRK